MKSELADDVVVDAALEGHGVARLESVLDLELPNALRETLESVTMQVHTLNDAVTGRINHVALVGNALGKKNGQSGRKRQ